MKNNTMDSYVTALKNKPKAFGTPTLVKKSGHVVQRDWKPKFTKDRVQMTRETKHGAKLNVMLHRAVPHCVWRDFLNAQKRAAKGRWCNNTHTRETFTLD
jgi:hypothetical protein